MIKLETHCHVYGTSPCADCADSIIIQKYKDAGYGAIVVTNHIHPKYFENYSGRNHKEKVDFYFSQYDRFGSKCKEAGIKTFFGAEVLVNCSEGHSEFTIYGFDRSFLYDNKPLYSLTQEELFNLAEKNNLFMYKTHPFRIGEVHGNPKFMHGAECFNGHYHHVNNNELAEKFCLENNLIRMSGTDFHHDDQPITAGIYIPNYINNESQLTEYIFKKNFELLIDNKTYAEELIRYKGVK